MPSFPILISSRAPNDSSGRGSGLALLWLSSCQPPRGAEGMAMLREGTAVGILSGGAFKVAVVGETDPETEFCNNN
jgi:hypothetical protein